ncbi:hypothetical protein TrVFT333_004699 [Trichoderma virens FT-333]|nr:hypothetical protein TrVFT333_004699 [Trichoderma virens FT-333]
MSADTDIGGPGVMFTFLIQSWITLACAAFPAFHAAKVAWKNPKIGACNGDVDNEAPDDERHMPPLVRSAAQLLNSLCDLQIITGMGVMIAGFAKWNTISFYHEALVTCYWNLTLNSLWAARSEYMDYETEKRKRGALRRIFALFSCVLGTAWQILTYQRELDPEYGVGAAGILSLACWIVIQWIAVWSFGDGFLPFTWFCYSLFNAWNVFDVVSLWQLNKDLLPGDEREWGFGQVLPLIMLLSILLSAVDI